MMTKRLILSILIVLLSAVGVSAQTFLTNTTLSSAVSATTTQIPLTATTGVAVGGAIYVDHEAMQVNAVNTTTKIVTVVRNQRPTAHATLAVVFIATALQRASNFVPHNNAISNAGVCATPAATSTASRSDVVLSGMTLPIIDIDTGDMYGCRRNGTSGSWVWNITNVTGINGAGSIPLAQ